MGKDYAQRESGGRQAKTSPALPGWLWLLAGIAIGVIGAAGYYISRPARPVDAVTTLEDKGKGNGKKKIEIPPKEPSRFTFYELLPKYEVVIPKEALKAEPKVTAPATAGGDRYFIQVGSFKSKAEAEQQKANLALLGIESQIEKIAINNTNIWYRVRIGARGEQKVQSIVARLDENHIESMVVKVPD